MFPTKHGALVSPEFRKMVQEMADKHGLIYYIIMDEGKGCIRSQSNVPYAVEETQVTEREKKNHIEVIRPNVQHGE